MKEQIIIIGGGPSGMMAGISAKTHYPNKEVILLERNKKLGIKLSLTGGGRCNVTARLNPDELIEYIPKNSKFLYSTFNQFNAFDIIDFFNKNGCELKEEDHFRMFPKTDKAADIIAALERKLNTLGVKVMFEQQVTDIKPDEMKIYTKEGNFIYSKLIIATGGITLPNTGSDGTGHELARKTNHTITKLLPAEVPLLSNDSVIQSKELQGLSFKDVSIKVYNAKNKIIKTLTHDLLITHFGISGPLALRASYDVINLFEKGEKEVKVSIDFIPSHNLHQLRTLEDSKLKEVLREADVPKRLIDYVKKDEEIDYLEKLKDFKLIISDTAGFKRAFVTNGGVSLKQIDPKTLKSKVDPNLSFCGEVLDLNAYTGGFNITTALATGYVAGKNLES